ncbi:glutamate-cysteine ligase family protein [Millisia brevis]|uniref:glutamate-cysteine ligase family protein n=1 Tax=Millisia brevis TaxID=264148 RepID=UPI0008374917|nr:glutamate-cysteine ligase family protein [Millisia brevis]
MGDEVRQERFTRQDRQRFRRKVQDCLEALATMLADDTFAVDEPRVGMEIELNLVKDDLTPSMANMDVLEEIADPDYQTELGRFNIELNVAPKRMADNELIDLEDELRRSLNAADARARRIGSRFVMIGMLPTLEQRNFDARWISPNPRYGLLDEQIFAARGEDMAIELTGARMPGAFDAEVIDIECDTILPEAACTSTQLHLQVAPTEFAAYWNAAQALAGVQVALAANSPFFIGRALWHENRIPVFEQATDTRPLELKNQGVRPRVWFGERWITSIFDLFEENSRYFPALLPECSDEDPRQVLDDGGVPTLAELRMHNGTVYRWNRPVYDTVDGQHHIRLENRVLPAAPSVLDAMADAAFYYGTLRSLAKADRPVWTQMSFDAASENLHAGAHGAFDARLYWPEVGWITPQELVLRRLLPLADAGLADLGVAAQTRDRYLGVIEGRCLAAQSGSVWQRASVAAREEAGQERPTALTGMLGDYLELMHSGEPVHRWPLG